MNQKELSEILVGKRIVKINYTDETEGNLAIESINLEGGELLTFKDGTKISHPEEEAEIAAFYEALKNVPSSGIISFKAKYLSQGLIDREISQKHKELNSDGYGQIKNNREDYLSYRFDMPND